MEFPTLVYKDSGPYQRQGGTYNFKPAKNEKELADLIDGGWFPTLAEAVAGQLNADENASPTRAELEAKATELGIKFDGRTTDRKLTALIDEKLAS